MSKFQYFKRRAAAVTIATALFLSFPTYGQEIAGGRLGEVEVTARRPLSLIGLQASPLDSAALRENISLSMADVIGFGSSVFVKSSGRATLATVSFRGASPSHTAVSWNGLPVNSPSLGMTDFSLIPAYFIDRAVLLHGSSSLGKSSGGLGGMVDLATSPADIPEGFSAQYVQGAGSFRTFDEFARVGYAKGRWAASTRFVCSTSRNDFEYTNPDKKLNIYDDDRNIIGQYHPRERNRNGDYRDLHLLQQLYFRPSAGHLLSLDVWGTLSSRGIPFTTVDYSPVSSATSRRQRENTLRAVASWLYNTSPWRLEAKAGYSHTHLAYDYGLDRGDGTVNRLNCSRTNTDVGHLSLQADRMVGRSLFLTAAATVTLNHVSTVERASPLGPLANSARRADASLALTARWQAAERVGLSAVVRQESHGSAVAAPAPAIFADWTISRRGNVTLRAGGSRNYRYPTLNDLYFLPGGNPSLRPEHGWSYDAGLSASGRLGAVAVEGAATWFDSYINDWIMWLPTGKGFFSPSNVKDIHSCGVELRAGASAHWPRRWFTSLDATLTATRSVNRTPLSDTDHSVGQQLPYVPRIAATATATVTWRDVWTLRYQWCHYSRRNTMTAGASSPLGSLDPYFMSNVSLERRLTLSRLTLSLKLAVNNLWDASYQTVMSHPMPGRNFELFLSLAL